MKKSNYKLLFLLPTFLLTSCQYGLREVYDGNAYNDPIFENNFYRVWDADIAKGSKKIASTKEIALDKDKDFVFTSYDDENFHACEMNYDKYKYSDAVLKSEDEEIPSYGPSFKLSNCDSSFRYGYISKLFDGKMFCNGHFQLARVQIDEGGFAHLFEKELSDASYFAMNFKSSLDYTTKYRFAQSNSTIKLTVSFYLKNNSATYDELKVSYVLDNVRTNPSESHTSNCYTFFGFQLSDRISLDRCAGFGVSYELIDVNPTATWKEEGSTTTQSKTFTKEELKSEGIAHSLMLYEVLLPNSTWR